ncbi:MAG: hypothetical protein ACRER2_17405 [Methylococcales bacterium]
MRPHLPAFIGAIAILIIALTSTAVLFVFLFRSEFPGNLQSGFLSSPSNFVLRDVELIKGQMNLLITGSMESKFAQLETSLKSGIISRRDLATLQELKENLAVLKAYSVQNASTAATLPATPTVPVPASLGSDRVLQEISNIRKMFYISIISWGGLIVVIAGTWLRSHYRFRQIKSERPLCQPLLDKPKTGFN